MQTQDNKPMCYRRGNRKTRQNTSPPPSKPSLPHILELSKLLLPTDLTKPCLLQFSGSHNSARLHPPNKWLLPMLPSSTKTLLYTQDGCGKCLGYQPLKDLEMERQELRKPQWIVQRIVGMKISHSQGYENLSLSRVVARVFSLKSTPQHMWVTWVYIVWVETWCIKYGKLAKQNVSRVSCRKALPRRNSRKPAVTICINLHIPVIC